jgi:23S rRNA (guanine2445-N2)-methyltransferase / 23S rRNA (guanine2069-N7)-methyltransferase
LHEIAMPALKLYASAPAPLCPYLRDELHDLGADGIAVRGAGVEFTGNLALAYRCCLWSRVASRVLLELRRFSAPDADALYQGARAEHWNRHLDPTHTIAVDCTTRRARIGHSHFAALRVKDAIADWFIQHEGARPSVDVRAPDLRFHLHLRGGEARLYLDLAGSGLHRRGYRHASTPAPLRETLAAGLLYFAGWPGLRAQGLPLLDPMCGAGTLLIEAAMMAGDIAPGLAREEFGFLRWRQHDEALWQELREQAMRRRDEGVTRLPSITGRDVDAGALAVARENISRIGLQGQIGLEEADVCRRNDDPGPGLLVCNPPYGERLVERDPDWRQAIEEGFPGWHVAMLLPQSQPPLRGVGARRSAVRNGPLECRFDYAEHARASVATALDAPALRNRLRKRQTHLTRWARRKAVHCYRLYDADLPEFALAVDRYESDQPWLHVAEYQAPDHVDPVLARRRVETAIEALVDCTGIPRSRVVLKRRWRQRGGTQYQRMSDRGCYLEVMEGPARLLVNLEGFLDTGLFLDHRPVRRWIGEHAGGARFLNLFAYTASASVHAALGGAVSTLSLDLSHTYCEWARRNLALNGFHEPAHRVAECDCIAWLRETRREAPFDLIFMDPPTFSNSARMQGTLDIKRDHVRLIEDASVLLAPGGALLFSCNRRGFRLDRDRLAGLVVEDITAASIDEDFRREPPPHRCYRIRRGD